MFHQETVDTSHTTIAKHSNSIYTILAKLAVPFNIYTKLNLLVYSQLQDYINCSNSQLAMSMGAGVDLAEIYVMKKMHKEKMMKNKVDKIQADEEGGSQKKHPSCGCLSMLLNKIHPATLQSSASSRQCSRLE